MARYCSEAGGIVSTKRSWSTSTLTVYMEKESLKASKLLSREELGKMYFKLLDQYDSYFSP